MLICPICEESIDQRDMRHIEQHSRVVAVCGECYERLVEEAAEAEEMLRQSDG